MNTQQGSAVSILTHKAQQNRHKPVGDSLVRWLGAQPVQHTGQRQTIVATHTGAPL